jgi:beta-glucanase (GH16 family)
MAKPLRVVLTIVIASVLTALTSASALAARPRLAVAPVGPAGNWRPVFDDEFNGTALNQNVWNAHNGWTGQNNVTDSLNNITVRGGHAIFRLASATSGAEIGTNHFRLRVGEYAEARIRFSGHGQAIYNWPAWWVSGPAWPAGGENDIAEGLGQLTINYHSPAGSLETGTVSGAWSSGFHTYGIYRGRLYSRVYWDGRLVRTYRTHDDGQPEMLLFTMGAANTIRTGAAGEMVVDYVRAWAPAP